MRLWLAIVLGITAARAETVDRLVAVVAAAPLLASQVELDRALAGVDPSPVPFWRLTSGESGAVDADVQRSIDALVLRETASDVALYQPSREQLADRVTELRAAFGPDDDGRDRWEAFLASRGLDDQRVESAVRRRMIVERFLLRNLQAPPDDVEAWTAEYRTMIAALRSRVRIRTIPAMHAADEASP